MGRCFAFLLVSRPPPADRRGNRWFINFTISVVFLIGIPALPDVKPQNPCFNVDSVVLTTCSPKVRCPQCGTIRSVPHPQEGRRFVCMACEAPLVLRLLESGQFEAVANRTIPLP